MRTVAFLLLFPMFTVSMVSLAANLHVDPNGSGTACSDAVPCSLNTANQQAKAGDRVLLRNGIYKTGIAPVNSGTSEARIDFSYELTGWSKVSGTDGLDAIRTRGE